MPGVKLASPLLVPNAVTPSSPAADTAPLVVTLSNVVPDVVLDVPVASSGLDVAAPLHSLTCNTELAPVEPLSKVTDVMPDEMFGAYQISIDRRLPRHTWAAFDQPTGAVSCRSHIRS